MLEVKDKVRGIQVSCKDRKDKVRGTRLKVEQKSFLTGKDEVRIKNSCQIRKG